MFNDQELKPLLDAGIIPKKGQFLRFIKENPLPRGQDFSVLDLKYKFKNKIDNNRAKEECKKKKKTTPAKKRSIENDDKISTQEEDQVYTKNERKTAKNLPLKKGKQKK